jgi:hypothetical protein
MTPVWLVGSAHSRCNSAGHDRPGRRSRRASTSMGRGLAGWRCQPSRSFGDPGGGARAARRGACARRHARSTHLAAVTTALPGSCLMRAGRSVVMAVGMVVMASGHGGSRRRWTVTNRVNSRTPIRSWPSFTVTQRRFRPLAQRPRPARLAGGGRGHPLLPYSLGSPPASRTGRGLPPSPRPPATRGWHGGMIPPGATHPARWAGRADVQGPRSPWEVPGGYRREHQGARSGR